MFTLKVLPFLAQILTSGAPEPSSSGAPEPSSDPDTKRALRLSLEELILKRPEEPKDANTVVGLHKHGLSTGLAVTYLAKRLSTIRGETNAVIDRGGSSYTAFLAFNPFVFRRGQQNRRYCSEKLSGAGTRKAQLSADQDALAAVDMLFRTHYQSSANELKNAECREEHCNTLKAKFDTAYTDLMNCASDPCYPNERNLRLRKAAESARALISCIHIDWELSVAADCKVFWAPGVYAGYTFGMAGALITTGNRRLALSNDERKFNIGLGSVGISWAPIPYFALLIGVNFSRLSIPAVMDGDMTVFEPVHGLIIQPMFSFGGSLDIFAKMVGK